ncbi:MAG: Asp23/Gls24 family envelope stress response protein [Negativicutes bacterium]|nr:Asp23/Gls24 family envelope stress response protein [Negativicutes bacterium]
MTFKRKQRNSSGEILGSLQVDDAVIASVAADAALGCDGVIDMSGGIMGEIAERLGKRNQAKGVKIEATDGRLVIDLFLVAEYGKKLPDLALDVQKSVKQTVENTVGVDVTEVNIHIQAIASSRQG